MALHINKAFLNQFKAQTIKQFKSPGYFYREDTEKTNVQTPPCNIDISQKYQNWNSCRTVEGVESTCKLMFEHVSKYSEIHTNRLHVSIAGLLLGKKVNLYSNSYWKNKEVFDHSLSKYPNINYSK